MAYTDYIPKNWVNLETIQEGDLDHIEQGIAANSDAVQDLDARLLATDSIEYENAWAAGTAYQPGDVVRYAGVDYLAVNASTGSVPPATSPLPLPPDTTGQNGKWLTVSGGAMVWSDLPVPAITNAQLPGRLQLSGPVITDCNTTIESGWYVVNTSATGSPDAATYHLLHVLNSTGLNSRRQFAYEYNGERSWTRRQTSGGAWTAWATDSGTWQAYTPTLSATGANPTLTGPTGRYCQIGRTTFCVINVNFGSASTPGSGTYVFYLPQTASNAVVKPYGSIGEGRFYDSSTGVTYMLGAQIWTGSYGAFTAVVASSNAYVTSAVPVVPADNDYFSFTLVYEAA